MSALPPKADIRKETDIPYYRAAFDAFEAQERNGLAAELGRVLYKIEVLFCR